MGFGLLDRTFFPPATRSQFVVEIQTPEGSRIAATDARVRALEQHLQQQEGVTAVTSFVGNGIPRFVLTFEQSSVSPSLGQLLVSTTSYVENARLIRSVREYVAANLPSVDLRIAEIALGPSNNYKVSYRISGPSNEVLRDLSENVKALMAQIPGAHEIYDDWRRRVPSHIVEVDQERARRAGVSSTGVATALQVLFEGVNIDTFREDIYRLPITLRGRTSDEEVSLLRIMNTPIPSSLGANVTVPLSQVADVRMDWLDGRLRRRDRIPTIEVQCNANEAEGHTAEVVRQELAAAIEEQISLPPGYAAEWGAEYESSRDSSSAVLAFLPVAVAIMILALTGQFNSYRKVTILFANIPFALIGVTVGLLLFQQPFGFVALLGLLSLVGMLVNIGIVLMDQIDQNLQVGQPPFDALVNASVARIRAISLSAGTTVLGMIPLVISDPFWRSLGVLVMFGLAAGAMLTPLIIPVLYSFLFRIPVKGGGAKPARSPATT
jgi:multidrug efflux pump subunit AcrB